MQPSSNPPGRALLLLFARLVPGPRRDEWLAEWRGELLYAQAAARSVGEPGLRTRVRLYARAFGSLGDARYLRRAAGGGGGRSFLRDGMRGLARRPGFALAVVGTLALGMGAATAIFSVVDGLLLRPLPFRDPSRLVEVYAPDMGRTVDSDAWREWRAQDRVFAALRAHAKRSMVLTGESEARTIGVELLEPGFLDMLGIRPVLGREFRPGETAPGRDNVVLLGDELWRSAFGASRDILGRSIRLDDQPYTVIGVLPPALRLLPGGLVHAVAPLPDPLPSALNRLMVLGRLRDDVPLAAAQARLDAVTAVLTHDQPRSAGWKVQLEPLRRMLTGSTRPVLLALLIAVTFLLLIACANAAGLLFVRGLARESELAIRRALGAPRLALFRDVLAESMLLALLAGGAAILIGWWGVRGLLALAPPDVLRFSYTTVVVDARIYGFALLLTVLTGLFFGVVPALRATRVAGSRVTSVRAVTASSSQLRMRRTVQIVQLGLAVTLLAGAGLAARSFLRLLSLPPGFDARNLLELQLSSRRRADPAARVAFNSDLDARLRALPGVLGVAWSYGANLYFEDNLRTETGEARATNGMVITGADVDTSYFRVRRIAVLEGRAFNAGDLGEGVHFTIINRALARLLWPDHSAVGHAFRIHPDEPLQTVVGVVDHVRLVGYDDRRYPFMALTPRALAGFGYATVSIRTSGAPALLAPAVRQLVHELDPGQPIISVQTAQQALADSVAQQRFLLVLMSVFGLSALLVAAVGVYGLVSFSVGQRAHEIGIRMAVGARSGEVLRGVFGGGMLLGVIGVTLGLLTAAALSRFTASLLFEVSPLDPLTYALVAVFLLVACALALLAPARKAARTDPLSILRTDC